MGGKRVFGTLISLVLNCRMFFSRFASVDGFLNCGALCFLGLGGMPFLW